MHPMTMHPSPHRLTSYLLYKRYSGRFKVCLLSFFLCLQGCSLAIPEGIKPVTGLDVHQYLGRWYEIARLDHRFERGLEQVTATYSLREDGSIGVENMGWNNQKAQQQTSIGKATFVSDTHLGHFKVSFQKPFYGSYVVFYLEADYSVALVCGPSRDYCWILARKPVLAPEKLAKYRKIAQDHGFAVEDFIYVRHTIPPDNVAAH